LLPVGLVFPANVTKHHVFAPHDILCTTLMTSSLRLRPTVRAGMGIFLASIARFSWNTSLTARPTSLRVKKVRHQGRISIAPPLTVRNLGSPCPCGVTCSSQFTALQPGFTKYENLHIVVSMFFNASDKLNFMTKYF